MTTKPRIFFIDDEAWFAKPYREALEREFEVQYFDDSREALSQLHIQQVDGVVLDVMMPVPYGASPEATALGLETGIWWLEQAKDLLVSQGVAVVVLTNRNRALFEERLANLRFSPACIEIRIKNDTPAFYLPGKLMRMISNCKKSAE